MSTTLLCYGVMVALKTKVSEEDRETLNDNYSLTGFQLNYEGTVAYLDVNDADGRKYSDREDIYKVLLFGGSAKSPHMEAYAKLCRILNEAQLEADLFKARWFSCIWHDGSDSPLNTMTLAEFNDPTFGA